MDTSNRYWQNLSLFSHQLSACFQPQKKKKKKKKIILIASTSAREIKKYLLFSSDQALLFSDDGSCLYLVRWIWDLCWVQKEAIKIIQVDSRLIFFPWNRFIRIIHKLIISVKGRLRQFFSRGSPMGQPDNVNHLPDMMNSWLLNPKFDVVGKCLEPCTPSLWDKLALHVARNEVRGVTFNMFWNKMSTYLLKYQK